MNSSSPVCSRGAVGDEAVVVAETQPVAGVADQPGADAASAVGLVDPERVELAPACQARERPAAGHVGGEVDEADQVIAEPGTERVDTRISRRSVRPSRGGSAAAGRSATSATRISSRATLVAEAAAYEQRPQVRPAVGDAVAARAGERTGGGLDARRPALELRAAGAQQGVACALVVRLEDEPADLAQVAVALGDPLLGGVAQEVGAATTRSRSIATSVARSLHPRDRRCTRPARARAGS